MKKLTDILENKNVILDENSDASLETLLTEAEVKPPENTDVGIVLSRLSDMISMSDDLYDTASSLEEIDKETAEAVEVTYNSLDKLYAMFDDKYDIFRSDFDMGDIEMDEDFRISLDDLLNEATDELSEAFLRLPGHFINNELYGVERDLNTFIKGLQNGNDVNMKELNNIIKILQSAKKEVKKFNKPEEVPVSFQYKKESIEEATRRSQVLTDLFHSLAQVEIQLRPNSTIHRMVEKKAGGNYTAEFKKMKKLVDPLVKMWGDIEMDLDTDHPRESINEAGRGDWVVVDLNTKKVTYVKSYDAASKYVKKNGGVIASAEYYVDNKKKFEDTSFEGEPLDEDKYTDLGLSVTHTLNMAQTFWYKLGGKVKVDPKKYAKLEADYVKRGKVTVKRDETSRTVFKNVMHNLTFKDKSTALFHVSDKPGVPTAIGNFDALGINGKRGNMFHSAIKDRDLKLKLKEELAPISEGMSDSTKAKRQAQFNKQAKMDDDNPKAYKPAPGDPTGKTKPSQYTKKYKQMYGEKIEGLAKKADETGVSYSILKQVFDRGMAAWKTSHRPGTTPHQWAYARVNSFLTGGKTQSTADADLWAKVSGKKESVELEEAVGKSTKSLLSKIGFKEAPINNITKKVLASVSGKKIEPSELFGISMRAGKWADIFVGTNDKGKFFVVDPSGLTLFNKESELVTALKSAALGESINNSIKGTKGLNDIVG